MFIDLADGRYIDDVAEFTRLDVLGTIEWPIRERTIFQIAKNTSVGGLSILQLSVRLEILADAQGVWLCLVVFGKGGKFSVGKVERQFNPGFMLRA